MSHFITAVITKNPSDYHKELAPFQENNMGDCPKEYLEFVDKTEEYKKQWQEESTQKVRLPNGNYISSHDAILRHYITKEEYNALDKSVNKGHDLLEKKYYFYDVSQVDGTLVTIPYKDIYKTLDEYVKDQWGENEWDEEMKAYGYWRNPNAKWDSYGLCKIGNFGRWQNSKIEEAFVKVRNYKLYSDKNQLINEYNKALEETVLSDQSKFIFKLSYGKYKNAEDYAERNKVIAPWSFVLDGHWCERGNMGWWGLNDATNETEEAFIKKFEEIMTDEKYQDYYIGFVNCHI